MKIAYVTLGAYQTNCYIVWDPDTNDCVVIDPGYDEPALRQALDSLNPTAVLLTHGHFDHVGAVGALQDKGCEIWMNAADLELPHRLCPLSADQTYHFFSDGDVVAIGALRFEVLHTPGHTPGSCCLLIEDILFAGDTLFAGSCGRTDLAGGSRRQMTASLKRLAALPDATTVLSGHGGSSTIEREKRTNPYLQKAVAK